MGWRFRKSFSPFPGVRFNFSPSGISTSIGVGAARIHIGNRGAAVTTRIPGTGISFRQPVGVPTLVGQPDRSGSRAPEPPTPLLSPIEDQGEIRSASTASLTTQGLRSFKDLLTKAQSERAGVLSDLAAAKRQATSVASTYEAWKRGWLFRRIRKNRFAALERDAIESRERVSELEEQEKLARLATEFEMPDSLRKAFRRLSDATDRLSESHRIWDTLSSVATDQFRERTTAASSVRRQLVTVSLGGTALIEADFKVPHLRNANGGDVFIYPGFLLYLVSANSFALVDARDVGMFFEVVNFIEEEDVPNDSLVVGQTWKKANKDGSPDRRFANNYQIPIARYGGLRLTSGTGLNEQYLVSNSHLAEAFVKEWLAFQASLPPRGEGEEPTDVPSPAGTDPYSGWVQGPRTDGSGSDIDVHVVAPGQDPGYVFKRRKPIDNSPHNYTCDACKVVNEFFAPACTGCGRPRSAQTRFRS
jgi:hypothetical protein